MIRFKQILSRVKYELNFSSDRYYKFIYRSENYMIHISNINSFLMNIAIYYDTYIVYNIMCFLHNQCIIARKEIDWNNERKHKIKQMKIDVETKKFLNNFLSYIFKRINGL